MELKKREKVLKIIQEIADKDVTVNDIKHKNFREIGLDSLDMIELSIRIEEDLELVDNSLQLDKVINYYQLLNTLEI